MPTHRILPALLASLLAGGHASAAGQAAADLEEVVVSARRLVLQGTVESASVGIALADQLDARPTLRPAELLEVVPGLVVTQHSGDGKANQYFLRGFNLDHGTDFATRVEGIPVNLPTNAHGQGYTDLNFIVPELVESIEYRKGTYYAEQGDFSAAGSADLSYRRRLDAPFATLAAGQDGYRRAVVAASPRIGAGDLLLGGELLRNDGPWVVGEGYRKVAAVAKYTGGDADRGWDVEAMGHDAHWRSTDQVPLRAISAGLIDLYGAIDPTDGGRTHRYSLSADGWRRTARGRLHANVYAVDYQLDLVSNFTYAIDPVHGDQFEQSERRHVVGADLDYQQAQSLWQRAGTFRAGLQVRYDDIAPVALYRTTDRIRYRTVREDDVREASGGLYASESLRLLPWLRTDLGARIDTLRLEVASSLAANSGAASDSIASPKLTLAFGPWAATEYFLNFGRGFHSNDARGATASVDPSDGTTPVARVRPLVPALGAEAGLRTARIPHLQLTAALWTIRLGSELVFSGDGGTTAPSRASRRSGLELGGYYAPLDHLVLDADLAWTRARYTDAAAAGDRIPDAVERVASLGVAVVRDAGWFGGARARYLGPAPLIEDNSARSNSTLLVNLEAGYHFSPALSATLSVLNALGRRGDDIEYYYASRLAAEAAPVADYHLHPVEPRTLHAALTVRLR